MPTEKPKQPRDIAALSLSVYLELMTVLGAYRDALVLVGGWAPYFILQCFGHADDAFRHVGSVDIDLAIDHRQVSPAQYAPILARLEQRGYAQRWDREGQTIPFSFERTVSSAAGEAVIQVDFLADEYEGTGRRHRHQRVQQELLARKARGCDVVFDHCFEYEVRGALPDGSENAVTVSYTHLRAHET